MKRLKFGFLKGLAHVEIWPSRNYQQYVPKDSVNIRLNRHWINVGNYLQSAVTSYEQGKVNGK
ncbi:MAG: hypothetical protein U9N57_00675 [Pseudomonadota bacterium]|jgi:hypothetical protein|nr:hypothetical protein [Pseudomonadota bacterium]